MGETKSGIITIFNTSYTLNASDTKRVTVGVPLDREFDPIVIFENPRYPTSKVVLSCVEWLQLCENSMQISALFSGGPHVTVELEEHTVCIGDFPQSVKLYNKNECVHMQELTFRNLMYASYAIQKALDERVMWKPYVKSVYEKLLRNVLNLARCNITLTEDTVARYYDSCCTEIRADVYEPAIPDIGVELRSYMTMHIYPTICKQHNQ